MGFLEPTAIYHARQRIRFLEVFKFLTHCQRAILRRALKSSFPAEARWTKWLESEFTDRKAHSSNLSSASRLPLSRLGLPGSIPALVLPLCGMATRHRKGDTAERFFSGDKTWRTLRSSA
ncbi:hypothetical protein T265_02633 [Opisthorchis viverrini]|uniref:Uncharacterized protein n=1 Tax=Opisthorchis viverrini TaxID=6198 RepID=A0A074ZVA8_OPIVI|nr:hypothetical protein T265_02633 [Opisthorchis viverrini]KER31071.1 hypothetical protein T265_02633 [Opisthorchis viverrini]